MCTGEDGRTVTWNERYERRKGSSLLSLRRELAGNLRLEVGYFPLPSRLGQGWKRESKSPIIKNQRNIYPIHIRTSTLQDRPHGDQKTQSENVNERHVDELTGRHRSSEDKRGVRIPCEP